MDSPRVVNGLTLAQVVNIVVAVFAAVMWLTTARSMATPEVPAAEPSAARTGEPIAPPGAGGSQGTL